MISTPQQKGLSSEEAIRRLQTKLEELTTQKDTLVSQTQSMRDELKKSEHDLQVAHREKSALMGASTTLKQELSGRERRINELNDTITSLQQKVLASDNVYFETLAKHKNELQTAHEQQEQTKKDLSDKENTISESTTLCSKLSIQVECLSSQLAREISRGDATKLDCQKLTFENCQLQKDITRLQSDLVSLKSQNGQIQRETQGQLRTILFEKESLNAQLAGQNLRFTELQNKNLSVEKDRVSLDAKIQSLTMANKKLQTEQQLTLSEIEDLRATNKSQKQSLQEQVEQNQDIQHDLDSKKRILQGLLSQMGSEPGKVPDFGFLNQALVKQTGINKQSSSKFEELSKFVLKLESEKQALEVKNQKTECQFEQLCVRQQKLVIENTAIKETTKQRQKLYEQLDNYRLNLEAKIQKESCGPRILSQVRDNLEEKKSQEDVQRFDSLLTENGVLKKTNTTLERELLEKTRQLEQQADILDSFEKNIRFRNVPTTSSNFHSQALIDSLTSQFTEQIELRMTEIFQLKTDLIAAQDECARLTQKLALSSQANMASADSNGKQVNLDDYLVISKKLEAAHIELGQLKGSLVEKSHAASTCEIKLTCILSEKTSLQRTIEVNTRTISTLQNQVSVLKDSLQKKERITELVADGRHISIDQFCEMEASVQRLQASLAASVAQQEQTQIDFLKLQAFCQNQDLTQNNLRLQVTTLEDAKFYIEKAFLEEVDSLKNQLLQAQSSIQDSPRDQDGDVARLQELCLRLAAQREEGELDSHQQIVQLQKVIFDLEEEQQRKNQQSEARIEQLLTDHQESVFDLKQKHETTQTENITLTLKIEQLKAHISRLEETRQEMESLDEMNNEEIKRLQTQKFADKSLLSSEKEHRLIERVDNIQLELTKATASVVRLESENLALQQAFSEERNLIQAESSAFKDQASLLQEQCTTLEASLSEYKQSKLVSLLDSDERVASEEETRQVLEERCAKYQRETERLRLQVQKQLLELASSERDRRNLEFALCKVRAESEVLKQTSAQNNFGNQQLVSLQEKLEIAEKHRNELSSRVNSYRETEAALAVALKEIVTLKESITQTQSELQRRLEVIRKQTVVIDAYKAQQGGNPLPSSQSWQEAYELLKSELEERKEIVDLDPNATKQKFQKLLHRLYNVLVRTKHSVEELAQNAKPEEFLAGQVGQKRQKTE